MNTNNLYYIRYNNQEPQLVKVVVCDNYGKPVYSFKIKEGYLHNKEVILIGGGGVITQAVALIKSKQFVLGQESDIITARESLPILEANYTTEGRYPYSAIEEQEEIQNKQYQHSLRNYHSQLNKTLIVGSVNKPKRFNPKPRDKT